MIDIYDCIWPGLNLTMRQMDEAYVCVKNIVMIDAEMIKILLYVGAFEKGDA